MMNDMLPFISAVMTGLVFSACTGTLFLLQIGVVNGKPLPGKASIKGMYLLMLIPLPFLIFSGVVCLKTWAEEVRQAPWAWLAVLLILIAITTVLFCLYDRRYLLPLSQKNSVPYAGIRGIFLVSCAIISALTMALLFLCGFIVFSQAVA